MDKNDLAPVVVFAYNRPKHLKATLDSLKLNALSDQTNIIFYSDGPKNDEDAIKVAAVRKVIEETTGFKSVTVNLAVENRGLAASIIDGVTSVVNQYGKVIVLEDDLITSQYFLFFMNSCLEYYKDMEKVMHVSGSAYPIDVRGLDGDTYMLSIPLCWGWATWSRSWKMFVKNIEAAGNADSKIINKMNFDGTHNFYKQVEDNKSGKKSTWFIFWYLNLLENKGLSVFPKNTLVENIGFDGSGENCASSNVYKLEKIQYKKNKYSLECKIEENLIAYERHREYFKKIKGGLASRVVGKIARIWRGHGG